MYKETSEIILSVNVRFFGENIVTSFILFFLSWQIIFYSIIDQKFKMKLIFTKI